MRHRTGSSVAQVMACRLFNGDLLTTRPLRTHVNGSIYTNLPLRKCIQNIVCKNSRHFVQAPCVHLFHFRIVNAWVGLIRLSGNYHWIDGTEYTNDDGSTNTRCMFVAVDLLLGVGVYDAEDCSKTKQFVCEDIPPPGRSTYSYRFLLKLVGVRGQCHDDDIKWKHFPRCWPFVRKPS